jgi:hypothetical protein
MSERPQYGEYASPEERVAAGGVPLDPVPEPASPAIPLQAPPGKAVPPKRNWEPILTVTLLALGGYTVLTSIPQYLDLATLLKEVFETAGYGVYTSVDLARSIGIAIIAVQSVIYVLVVELTIPRLRAKKLAFVFPLVGGALAGVFVFVLLAVAIISDPALMQAATGG